MTARRCGGVAVVAIDVGLLLLLLLGAYYQNRNDDIGGDGDKVEKKEKDFKCSSY